MEESEEDLKWTPEMEVALFKAMLDHKPVGKYLWLWFKILSLKRHQQTLAHALHSSSNDNSRGRGHTNKAHLEAFTISLWFSCFGKGSSFLNLCTKRTFHFSFIIIFKIRMKQKPILSYVKNLSSHQIFFIKVSNFAMMMIQSKLKMILQKN